MMHTVLVPLFPGYLFVNLSPADPWSPVRNAPGIASILMACGRPEQVGQGLVEELQATEGARTIPKKIPRSDWTPGNACRVHHGAWQHHDAVVIHLEGTTGVRVAVPLFGGMREMTVPVEWLEAR